MIGIRNHRSLFIFVTILCVLIVSTTWARNTPPPSRLPPIPTWLAWTVALGGIVSIVNHAKNLIKSFIKDEEKRLADLENDKEKLAEKMEKTDKKYDDLGKEIEDIETSTEYKDAEKAFKAAEEAYNASELETASAYDVYEEKLEHYNNCKAALKNHKDSCNYCGWRVDSGCYDGVMYEASYNLAKEEKNKARNNWIMLSVTKYARRWDLYWAERPVKKYKGQIEDLKEDREELAEDYADMKKELDDLPEKIREKKESIEDAKKDLGNLEDAEEPLKTHNAQALEAYRNGEDMEEWNENNPPPLDLKSLLEKYGFVSIFFGIGT